MTHSLGEAWVLDDDRTAHGSCTDPVDLHVPHALEAISGCELTELYLPSQTYYESYSETVTLLCSAPPPPGAKPGSASNPYQPPTGKVESTLLFGQQL